MMIYLKRFFLAVLLSVMVAPLFAQVADQEKTLRKQAADTIMGWKAGMTATFAFSQVSLTNWAAGGDNSVSGIGNVKMFLKHADEHSLWINNLVVGYGKQRVRGDVTKTDDRFLFTSKYGRKLSESLYYAGMIDFKTQMDVGYSSTDETLKISNFMAPAYLFASLGLDFAKGDQLSLYFAPFTSKTTFVLDKALADSGSFGLKPGETVRGEFGGYIKLQVKYPVMKNINLSSRLDLFSNYLDHPQNIDVDFGVDIDMIVNKWITVTINTNLLYDDDVKIAYDSNGDDIIDGTGPRIQFKELFGVGLTISL